MLFTKNNGQRLLIFQNHLSGRSVTYVFSYQEPLQQLCWNTFGLQNNHSSEN